MRRGAAVCPRLGIVYDPVLFTGLVAILPSMVGRELPLHRARELPAAEEDFTGWDPWRGDAEDEEGEFEFSHVGPVVDRDAFICDYLSLPPGWRFVVAPAHFDLNPGELMSVSVHVPVYGTLRAVAIEIAGVTFTCTFAIGASMRTSSGPRAARSDWVGNQMRS